MTHEKRQSTLIQVKSAPTDNNQVVKLVQLTNKTADSLCGQEVMTDLLEWKTKVEKTTDDCLVASERLATKETSEEDVSATEQIDQQHEDNKTEFDGEFIEVQLKMARTTDNAKGVLEPEMMGDDNNGGETKEDNDRKKKKKKKKRKKKKNIPGSQSKDDDAEMKLPIKLAPIKKSEAAPDKVDTTKTDRANPKPAGCFGFVSTWLAKRKEKRREKKRKAIEARKGKSVGTLVEYQHKQARGGVAFTVEVDSRPMNKSVLPPISRRPGPIRMASDQKWEKAGSKREDHVNKKRDAARAHSRLVYRVAERRAQKEELFKQTTLEKMKAKEDRVSSRLEYNRKQRAQSRCTSKMESKLDILTARWESIVAAPLVYRNTSPLPSEEDSDSIDYYTEDDSDDVNGSWDYWRQ